GDPGDDDRRPGTASPRGAHRERGPEEHGDDDDRGDLPLEREVVDGDDHGPGEETEAGTQGDPGRAMSAGNGNLLSGSFARLASVGPPSRDLGGGSCAPESMRASWARGPGPMTRWRNREADGGNPTSREGYRLTGSN